MASLWIRWSASRARLARPTILLAQPRAPRSERPHSPKRLLIFRVLVSLWWIGGRPDHEGAKARRIAKGLVGTGLLSINCQAIHPLWCYIRHVTKMLVALALSCDCRIRQPLAGYLRCPRSGAKTLTCKGKN